MTVDQNVRRLRARYAEQQQASILEQKPLESFLFRPGRARHGDGTVRDEAGWLQAEAGTRWGGTEPWAAFRATFRIPTAWEGSVVRLLLPLGGQCMAYLDGQPWQGLDGN